MKNTIKHQATRGSTWALGALAVLGGLWEVIPELKVLLPPPVAAGIAVVGLVAKVIQGKVAK
jgi:hypothetical protein